MHAVWKVDTGDNKDNDTRTYVGCHNYETVPKY